MRVLFSDWKKGIVKLKIEREADLWYLSRILNKGDKVKSKTTRRIEIEGKKDRSTRKTYKLTLRIEDIEFHSYSSTLRLNGRIEKGPEEVGVGSYHTFNIQPGSIIKIKKEWPDYQKQELKESIEGKAKRLLLVVIDRGEAHFALLKEYGLDFKGSVTHPIPGTRQPKKMKQAKREFLGKVYKAVEDWEPKVDKVIVGSLGFWAENFKEFAENKREGLEIKTCKISNPGRSGLQEIIRRGIIDRIRKDARINKETKAIEELMKKLKREKVVYNFNKVKKAAEYGAIEKLLVSGSALRDENARELMSQAKNKGSEILILSTEKAKERLEGLGRMAAFLRFKI